MRRFVIPVVCVAVWACGEDGGSKAGSDAATPADTAADSATTADTAATADTTTGDATTTADTTTTDTTSAPTPSEAACQALAQQYCDAMAKCCGAPAPGNCLAAQEQACMKAGYLAIEDAAGAGDLKLDAARDQACKQAVTQALSACDRQAFERARKLCLQAWTDSVAIGETCHATAPLACAQGKGTCDPKTTDEFVCAKAGSEGDGCKLGSPCGVDLECLDTQLTRAKVCGKPGSTCHLGDDCWDGWVCESGKCAKDPKAIPASCQADGDCPTTHGCKGGKCVPKLCG